jgi:hypothetical protein
MLNYDHISNFSTFNLTSKQLHAPSKVVMWVTEFCNYTVMTLSRPVVKCNFKLKSLRLTLCTTSSVLPTQCIYVFIAWISEQTAIISLYSINLSVFTTEAESVYCAVRAESVNQIDTV